MRYSSRYIDKLHNYQFIAFTPTFHTDSPDALGLNKSRHGLFRLILINYQITFDLLNCLRCTWFLLPPSVVRS